ncbi:MAG: chemotaxis protein CheW, partial [Alistipes sp.]|nr:chemotaxis protein CheW [Alistipes sp.]
MKNATVNEENIMKHTELDDTYLTFYSSKKLFGINIGKVVQIISYQAITTIPEFPPYA